MLYIFARLIDHLLCPSALLLLFCIAGLLLTLRRRTSVLGLRFLLIGIGGLTAFALLPLDVWMLRPLENRFPMPGPLPEHVDGIVGLGGAIGVDASVDRGVPVLTGAAGRMTAFVALAHRYPQARLVFSGGNGDPFVAKTSEAEIARGFFREMGIDVRRVMFENKSRNTRENALFSDQLVKPRAGERWLLVTTAADLPRAVGAFREVGWPVIAVPADYHTLRHSAGFGPGMVEGLRNADWAAHEWLGLIYYHARGWTPALFPGPA